MQPLPAASPGDEVQFSLAHPFHILVAEDNMVNQKVAEKLFNRLGYSVEMVANGMEAVQRSGERPFDLIFMDIQMPIMDGITATQEIIKRAGSGKRPTIIAMTAHALKGDREKMLAAGMDDYISKPVRMTSLKNLLQKIFTAQNSERQNQPTSPPALVLKTEPKPPHIRSLCKHLLLRRRALCTAAGHHGCTGKG